MRQQTLAAQTGFEKYGRKTKRERFLEEMEQVVPWAELQGLVEPYYPKGENGRPTMGLSIMLRMYFLQQWFNLSDPGAEDALYESPAVCGHRSGARAGAGREHHPSVPSPVGETRTGRGDAERGEPVSGEPGHPHHHGDDCGRDHYSRALVDQETERRARSGDASDAQGEAVVLRVEGTHRSGLQARPCAFGVHVGGFGGGPAHAAGSAARRGAQGVGRRWISGTGRSHPAGGSAGARYDQPKGAIQELCGRITKGQEPGEGQSASEGGTSVPDSEAHLRFREGEIPRDSEEPSSTVRQLCAGELVPAPQTAGGGEGVVSLNPA